MNTINASSLIPSGSLSQSQPFELLQVGDTPMNLTQISVDVPRLLELTGGDRTLGQDFLECFLEYAPTYLDKLKEAKCDRDFAKLVYQAHQLKGAAAMVAARSVFALAQQIEADAETSQSQNLTALIAQLEDQLIEVQRFLETW